MKILSFIFLAAICFNVTLHSMVLKRLSHNCSRYYHPKKNKIRFHHRPSHLFTYKNFDFRNMQHWPEQKITYVEKNFEPILESLVTEMTNNLKKQTKELKIKGPKELFGFLLTYKVVYLEFALKMAKNISNSALASLDPSFKPQSLRKQVMPSLLYQALKANKKANYEYTKSLSKTLKMDYFLEYPAYLGSEAIKEIYQFTFYDEEILHKRVWQLALLLSIFEINQNSFQKRLFFEGYKEMKKAINNKMSYSQYSDKEIKNIIASQSCFKEELPENPFIKSLKHICTHVDIKD